MSRGGGARDAAVATTHEDAVERYLRASDAPDAVLYRAACALARELAAPCGDCDGPCGCVLRDGWSGPRARGEDG